jgi:hypothetical protein
MHKNTTKCNKTLSKWCKNKHGASKIIDAFETYHGARLLWAVARGGTSRGGRREWAVAGGVAAVAWKRACAGMGRDDATVT